MNTVTASHLLTPMSLFGAFADETRLRILNLLCVRELCVCDICEVLDEIQPKVSRHLAILREAGLVHVRHEGKWKFYSLPKKRSQLQSKLLGCVDSCLSEIGILSADRARLGSTRVNLRCA
jgi:DNA-binding transcriptional ArsR family regulator